MTRILKAMFLVVPGVASCGSSHLRSKTEPLSLGVPELSPFLAGARSCSLGWVRLLLPHRQPPPTGRAKKP